MEIRRPGRPKGSLGWRAKLRQDLSNGTVTMYAPGTEQYRYQRDLVTASFPWLQSALRSRTLCVVCQGVGWVDGPTQVS